MPNPLGYYYYYRDSIDGLLPASPPEAMPRPAPKLRFAGSHEVRQSLGLLLLAAAICIPIAATGAIAFALRLLT